MAPKNDEQESEEDEEEEHEEKKDEEKKKPKKKSPSEENVTYFGAINISDSLRTTLAYASALLSLVGLILAVMVFVKGLQEDNYLSDFTDLVKGYSGGAIFMIMMVVGVAAGLVQLFGCHVCFRATISVERKKLYKMMWLYMVALLGVLVTFIIANVIGLIQWMSASSVFQVLYL